MLKGWGSYFSVCGLVMAFFISLFSPVHVVAAGESLLGLTATLVPSGSTSQLVVSFRIQNYQWQSNKRFRVSVSTDNRTDKEVTFKAGKGGPNYSQTNYTVYIAGYRPVAGGAGVIKVTLSDQGVISHSPITSSTTRVTTPTPPKFQEVSVYSDYSSAAGKNVIWVKSTILPDSYRSGLTLRVVNKETNAQYIEANNITQVYANATNVDAPSTAQQVRFTLYEGATVLDTKDATLGSIDSQVEITVGSTPQGGLVKVFLDGVDKGTTPVTLRPDKDTDSEPAHHKIKLTNGTVEKEFDVTFEANHTLYYNFTTEGGGVDADPTEADKPKTTAGAAGQSKPCNEYLGFSFGGGLQFNIPAYIICQFNSLMQLIAKTTQGVIDGLPL